MAHSNDQAYEVLCNSCDELVSSRRYKCLRCFDFDLCGDCYDDKHMEYPLPHRHDHPVQLVLTPNEERIYLRNEQGSVDIFDSFTCPFCGQMGLTRRNLRDHVTNQHANTNLEVMCPLCAVETFTTQMTNNLANHLATVHSDGTAAEIRLRFTGGSSDQQRVTAQRAAWGGVGRGRSSQMYQNAQASIAFLAAQARDIMPRPEVAVSQDARSLASIFLNLDTAPGESRSTDADILRRVMQTRTGRCRRAAGDREGRAVVMPQLSNEMLDLSDSISSNATFDIDSSVESANPTTFPSSLQALISTSAPNFIPSPRDPITEVMTDERSLVRSLVRPKSDKEQEKQNDTERANRSLFLQDLFLSSFCTVESGAEGQQQQKRSSKKVVASKHSAQKTKPTATIPKTRATSGPDGGASSRTAMTSSGVAGDSRAQEPDVPAVDRDQGSAIMDGGGGGDAANSAQNGASDRLEM